MLAIVLLAHGSRDCAWRKPMDQVALRIRELSTDHCVHCAFLELSEPDLSTTVAKLVSLGATDITVLPIFIGMGKHARDDIPLLVRHLVLQFPGVKFELKPSVGEDRRMINLMAQIALS
jgi:sirohydrochlorin cobaltochelatase